MENDDLKCQKKEKEDSKCQSTEKAKSKCQPKDKDASLDKDQTNNEQNKVGEKEKDKLNSKNKNSKCQKKEKEGSKCQPKEKEKSKYQPKEKVESKYLNKEIISKCQPRQKKAKCQSKDKDLSLDKDQFNNESNKVDEKEKSKLKFKKKIGTAQSAGQHYETGLLCLYQVKAIFDQDITAFYLASNIEGVGALDDICLRFKSNENNTDVLVFIQTKHRNNISEKTNIKIKDVRENDGDFGIQKYYISYLEIRKSISNPKIQNCLFAGDNINNLDCYFIIYTPAGHSINDSSIKLGKPNSKVNGLIETRNDGVVFQLKYEQVGFLLHDLIEKRFEELAKVFLDIILNGNLDILNDELVESYRVVILHYVIDISEDVSESTHNGKFRSDFFENNEKYTTMFREKLYHEVIQNKLNDFIADKENLISTHEGSRAKNIVKNIGKIIRYDEESNQFILIENSLLNCDLFDQTKEETKFTSAKDVVEIAGKEILMSLEFKIPVEFVDTDMKITKLRRFNFLASGLLKLFENAKDQNGVQLIEIDENMLDANNINGSVFDQNGGLGSAVGNLLIIDQESNTFKFNNDNLPPNAKKLWENLNLEENLMKIKEDLMSYRFKICIQGFPKVSIEDVASDEYLVKYFLSKLWFYTGQAKYDTVEVKTKEIIKKHIKTNFIPESIFEVRSDAVYCILHNYIEKWWESEEEKEFLTKSTTILDEAISQLVNNPILTALNLFCVNKLKSIGIKFNEDAVKLLDLDKFTSGFLTIITDSTNEIMTGAKLNQHFKESCDHIFINLNYVVNHFLPSLDKILNELESRTIKTLIIICESMENSRYCIHAFKPLKQKMYDRKIIIVANKNTYEELNKDDMISFNVINDKNSLNDLSPESQEKVLNESTVLFQGIEVNLKTIIDSDSKHIISSDVLKKLVNKEVLELGVALTTSNYMEELYVHRTITRETKQKIDVDTLTDHETTNDDSIKNNVVEIKNLLDGLKEDNMMVITAPLGMGKSTLLTHLSVETKKEYPNMWIARINLPEHSYQFYIWKHNTTVIDIWETFLFLINAVINENREVNIELTIVNNELVVKRDSLSVQDLLELDYFIYCCKTGNIIFLFDGFDSICPEYESLGIQLIKSTVDLINEATTSSATGIKKAKIWIAGTCYKNVKITIEREFGKSYTLQPLSDVLQRTFLNKFWKVHLKLDKFTNEQLANVKSFIEYMMDGQKSIEPISMSQYDVYATAVDFFLNEIKSNPLLANKEMFKSICDLEASLLTENAFGCSQESLIGNPVYLYLAADNFQNEIKGYIVIY